MSTQVKVKSFLKELVDQTSFVNVLDIPMVEKLDVNPETIPNHPMWYDFIHTGSFCNTFIALNPEYAGRFTTVEREFRKVRELMRNGVIASRKVA